MFVPKEIKLGNEAAIRQIDELLRRVPRESFSEKEIRLYVFGSTSESKVSWSGVHGVVGRVLPEHAVLADGSPAFPERAVKNALWEYSRATRKYQTLRACPACGKAR